MKLSAEILEDKSGCTITNSLVREVLRYMCFAVAEFEVVLRKPLYALRVTSAK